MLGLSTSRHRLSLRELRQQIHLWVNLVEFVIAMRNAAPTADTHQVQKQDPLGRRHDGLTTQMA